MKKPEFEIELYQARDADGRLVPVTKLTEAEAKQQLCLTMDLIGRLEQLLVVDVQSLIDAWSEKP